MIGQSSSQSNHERAQRCCVGAVAHLRATALATGFGLMGMQQAWANDCIPNQRVPYAMIEIQSMAFPDIDHLKRPGWYSTSSQAQADTVFEALNEYQHKMRSLIDITRFHILNMPKGSLVLYGNNQSTCGFLGIIGVDTATAKYAISQANAVFEQEQSAPKPKPVQSLEYIQAQMRERFEAVMYLVDYGQDTPEAQRYCEKLVFDNEIGVIPELEELEVNGTFRGQAARFLPNNIRTKTKETERFLSNAVGYENQNRYWRMDGFILLQKEDATDILVVVGKNLCGVNSLIQVPNDVIEFLLNAPHEPTRSTQPGDPVFNMSDDERRAWQSIQGVLQGDDPIGGLQRMFKHQSK